MKKLGILPTGIVFFLSISLEAKPWDKYNDPTIVPGMELRFDQLPLSGQTPRKPWSGWSWKEYDGGIAYRWQLESKVWDYRFLTDSELKRMPKNQRDTLSPAEKLDLIRSDSTFSVSRDESRRNQANAQNRFGICHGWSAASLSFKVPRTKTITLETYGDITLYSHDIKAILSYYAGEISTAPVTTFGRRCYQESVGTEACRDINAGTFHVVLANRLGRDRKGLIMERDGGIEIWNKPLHKFHSRVISKNKVRLNEYGDKPVNRLKISTDLVFAERIDLDQDLSYKEGKASYQYYLDTDENGFILGGKFISRNFPDFLWYKDVSLQELEARDLRDVFGDLDYNDGASSDDHLESYSCPKESVFEDVEGSKICRNQDKGIILGPITDYMKQLCAISYDAVKVCSQSEWVETVYWDLYSQDECPAGSKKDLDLNVCMDLNSVYGPFKESETKICVETLNHIKCKQLKWPVDLYRRVINQS